MSNDRHWQFASLAKYTYNMITTVSFSTIAFVPKVLNNNIVWREAALLEVSGPKF